MEMEKYTDNEVMAAIWSDTKMMARVEDGAAWLDSVKPNWYLEVNIQSLDISSGEQCICGQVFMDEVLQSEQALDEYEDSFYEHGYDYAVYALLSNAYTDDAYRKASDFGFNIAASNSEVSLFKAEVSDRQRLHWERWEWDLLASEWILQIEKRVAMHSVGIIESGQ